TGREKIAPEAPPLRFQFLLNGKPLADEPVSVALGGAQDLENQEHPPVFTPGSAFGIETDKDGILTYSLADCLKPEEIATARFGFARLRQVSEIAWDIPAVPPSGKPKPPENEWPGPWIFQNVRVRPGRDHPQKVYLHAGDLEVRLEAFEGWKPGT